MTPWGLEEYRTLRISAPRQHCPYKMAGGIHTHRLHWVDVAPAHLLSWRPFRRRSATWTGAGNTASERNL